MTAELRLQLRAAKTEAARDRAERLELLSKVEKLEEQIDFWQRDSATAWDKCEERRLAQIAAELKLAEIRSLLGAPDGWDEVMATRALIMAKAAAEAREAALLAGNEVSRETLLRHNADCDRRIRKAEAEIARLNDHIEGVALDTHKITVGLVKGRDAANALNERLAESLWFYSPAGYREIFGADAVYLGAKA